MPSLADALKLGGACFGLGAMAAGVAGPWAALAGLILLAAGFVVANTKKT